MFQVIESETADVVWRQAAAWFVDGGIAEPQPSRNGETLEVLRAGLCVGDPRQRWIASRIPAISPAFAIAEVIWILTGRNDSAFLNYFNRDLPKFAGEGSTYYGAYGHRLRHSLGIDQLEHAYNALRADPTSRQVVLQVWDSRLDLPNEDGTPRSKDIPCNIVSLLKVRRGRLEWTQVMRSNDLFRGLPHNIIQFTSLQEVLAGWLQLDLGAYHHLSDSLHLYEDAGDVRERLEPTELPSNNDSLALQKSESESSFRKLGRFADRLVSESSEPEAISAELDDLHLTEGFRNLAAVLAAEALRRRKRMDQACAILTTCSNECLKIMFERWRLRKEREFASRR